MKKYEVLILVFLVVLFSGCIESIQKGIESSLGNQPEDQNYAPVNSTVEVPVLSFEAEKIVYYFCDQNSFDYCLTGYNKFASFSEEFLYCQFKTVDEKFYADSLIELREYGVTIKLFFDRQATFTVNDYPREDSMYGYLLSNLVDVQNGQVTDSFCVSDKGVLLSTGFEPSKNQTIINSSFYIVYNTEMSGVLTERFFESYQN